MDVLQLVTTESSFFRQQVAVLEDRGVSCTTISLPDRNKGRSAASYVDLYRRVLASSREQYDLVHANYGLVGPLALAQPRRPVVLSLWGSDVMGAARWLDAISATAARWSDAVIAPSTAVSERLDCEHHLVPFGVDTDLFSPTPRPEARELLGWDPDERVVLFPYSPDRSVKNYPLAERVVARVDGDPVLRTISDVPYDRVPLYMNASDAIIVSSRRESGPMVIKEAVACNVPVVATDVGFAAEVLDGVENSYVRSSEAGLAEALSDAIAAGRSDGRASADLVSLDRMGDRLLDVYETVLDGPIPSDAGVSDVRA